MRTALITGTSSGFGLATTLELSRRGWRVFATMRNIEKRGALEEALKQTGVANQVEITRLDVTETAAMKGVVDAILAHANGRLDAVVHNAGVAVEAAFEDLPEPQLRRVMETNFFSVLERTRLLLPQFRKQRRGPVSRWPFRTHQPFYARQDAEPRAGKIIARYLGLNRVKL